MLSVPPLSVVVPTKTSGASVTQAWRLRPSLTSTVVAIARATTARSWLATPNIGHSVRIEPVKMK
ncbi:hypothetical protein D3C83_213030 [compost metagenome]